MNYWLARSKSQADLVREWDSIAKLRFEQISSGIDITFHHVLVPAIRALIKGCDFTKVLDVGCGSGRLCDEVAARSEVVVGIDPSATNISLAKEHYESPRISFEQTTLEDFAEGCPEKFTLAVANMTLMVVMDLEVALRALRSLLSSNGHFVFSVPHPVFWPQHCGYSEEPWFKYEDEVVVEGPFRIALDRSSKAVTTHVHRPLSTYISTLRRTGFLVEDLSEPMPGESIQDRYPARWRYPRFMLMKCRCS